MRRGRHLLLPFVCFSACNSFQTLTRLNPLSLRHLGGPRKNIFSQALAVKPPSATEKRARAFTSALSASTSPGVAMVDQGVSLIGKTTSMLVAGTFFTVLAWKRDALMVSFFVGAIGNGILSKVLKKWLNQSRPATRRMEDDSWLSVEPSDGGMPSSHAMSLGFIGTFTSLALPQLVWPISAYVIVSLMYRVRSSLHTTQQVGVGLSLGTLNGYTWWHLCHGTLHPSIHLMNVVSDMLLVDGRLPWPFLAIPAALGLAVVGSFERRISRWVKLSKKS